VQLVGFDARPVTTIDFLRSEITNAD